MFVRLNEAEMSALAELTYLQRCLYVFGIKPYMDLTTGIVGKARGISWQSIQEALYIPPHAGRKDKTATKDQLRRAADMVEKAGLIKTVSADMQLVFFCPLATTDNSAKNKAAIFPPSQADMVGQENKETKTNGYNHEKSQAAIPKTVQAATPPVSGEKNTSSTVVDDGHPEEEIRVTPTASALRIPYQQIVDLYHQFLPASQRVKELTEARRKHIKARWTSGELPDLETWREYFQHIAQSKFLTGREHDPDRAPYFAPFDWIITQRAYVNILEGKYHRTRASTHGQVSRRTH